MKIRHTMQFLTKIAIKKCQEKISEFFLNRNKYGETFNSSFEV